MQLPRWLSVSIRKWKAGVGEVNLDLCTGCQHPYQLTLLVWIT
ncbi:MAG: hypothetical protein UW95_C0032G0005 [Parcubacteria group bacterium GW2011_GWC1_45_14]|nr:MAG: hypothetical protein UW95_C0032G0005 [Parcubacteria group bacterium GW2011_GWC1_45_14]